jgi:uncharacterized membrane protein YwzB
VQLKLRRLPLHHCCAAHLQYISVVWQAMHVLSGELLVHKGYFAQLQNLCVVWEVCM